MSIQSIRADVIVAQPAPIAAPVVEQPAEEPAPARETSDRPTPRRKTNRSAKPASTGEKA